MNMEETHLDQCTQEHLPQAVALLDSDEWLQLFHPPVYPSEYEKIQELRLAVSTVLTALSALRNPWVKTEDMLSDKDNVDSCMEMIAWSICHGVVIADCRLLLSYPEMFPYWMPIPPLPEPFARGHEKGDKHDDK